MCPGKQTNFSATCASALRAELLSATSRTLAQISPPSGLHPHNRLGCATFCFRQGRTRQCSLGGTPTEVRASTPPAVGALILLRPVASLVGAGSHAGCDPCLGGPGIGLCRNVGCLTCYR